MGLIRPAFKLRVELNAHEPGVVGQLHDLHQTPVGGQSGQYQPRPGQLLAEVVVELIAVAVALGDLLRAVGLIGKGVVAGDAAGIGAQAHGAPLVGNAPLVGHQVDDRMGSGLGQLAGVGVRHAAHVAGKLHHGHLHAQADAQEGHLLLPCIAHRGDFALDAPVAEAAGDQNAVGPRQKPGGVLVGDRLRVHPAHLHLDPVFDAAVGQGLGHRQIGVVEGHILAHQGDLHAARGVFGPVDHGGPLGQVRHVADEAQAADHHVGQPLPLQHQGHLVEQTGGEVGDDVLRRDVAEQGDLVPHLLGDGVVAAAQNHVGLDAQGEQLLGRVLGGLALQLAGAGDGDNQRDVDEHHIVPAPLGGHLADGLQEGLTLNIAHGAADLHDGHVRVRRVQSIDIPLDFAGDMGDDLDRAPQVVPPALPVEDIPVHLAGGDGGVDGEIFVNEPLIVAQIQVGLRPVIGDEHLPVLIGAHGPGVHVEVGVQLLDLDPQAPLLQQPAQRGRGDALAQAGHHAAGDENKFGCHCHSSVLK